MRDDGKQKKKKKKRRKKNGLRNAKKKIVVYTSPFRERARGRERAVPIERGTCTNTQTHMYRINSNVEASSENANLTRRDEVATRSAHGSRTPASTAGRRRSIRK